MNLQLDSAYLFDTPFAAAFLTWLFDDLTSAVAAWTCLRDVKEPTRTDHLSASGTRRTTCSARARLGASAVAFVAGIKLLNLNHLLCSESRLLQLDFHVVPQIRTTTPVVGACPRPAAKERLENSAAKPPAAEHFAEDFERIMETAAAETGTALRERGVTEAIVRRAFVWIHQDVVRFAQFFKFFLGVRIVRIFVRMKFNGEFAIGAFDLLIGGSSPHAEHIVVIAFLSSHQSESRR